MTTEGLRRAFRAAALRHHPDKQPEAQREAAATLFAEVEIQGRLRGDVGYG